MNTIGDRIQMILSELGKKKVDLANDIGITSASVTTMCNGKSNPSNQTIKLICNTYKVNEQWLRTGEGEMFRAMSEREELAAWVAEINSMPTTSVQRRVAHMLTLLDPVDWITIDKIIKALIAENKESEHNKEE